MDPRVELGGFVPCPADEPPPLHAVVHQRILCDFVIENGAQVANVRLRKSEGMDGDSSSLIFVTPIGSARATQISVMATKPGARRAVFLAHRSEWRAQIERVGCRIGSASGRLG